MQTRQEMMAAYSAAFPDREESKRIHREFYAQFCSPALIHAVCSFIGRPAIAASRDEHLNDIPLRRWDCLRPIVMGYCGSSLSRANGSGGVSLSDCVCVAKQAARMWKESQQKITG